MRQRSVPSVAVVDRDPMNCLLLREVCSLSAWHVVGCAHEPREGMALVARTRPDCLITDYKFEGPMTGLHLIAQAKELMPKLYALVLTGWDIKEVAAQVTAFPPDRVLRKPVPPHELMNVLQAVQVRMNTIRINAV